MLAGRRFDDPFQLPSTASFPLDLRSSFDTCLYFSRQHPLYAAASKRIFNYFLTDLDYEEDLSEDNRKKLHHCLTRVVKIFPKLERTGREHATYGQAFVRCVKPFDRFLKYPKEGGGHTWVSIGALKDSLIRYSYKDLMYEVPDIAKRNNGQALKDLPKIKVAFKDLPSSATDRFDVVFLNPRYVRLDKPEMSDDTEVIYTFPPNMVERVRSGNLHEVRFTSEEMLRAIADGNDYRFAAGEVFHFREEPISGVSDSGWAIPAILWHWDTLYQMQVYRKHDQVVARDRLRPLRVISPAAGVGSTDTAHQDMLLFRTESARMLAKHRADPYAVHSMSIRPQMDELGAANGSEYSAHELHEVAQKQFFDGLGYPIELYEGTMTISQMPTAIRMFENNYRWIQESLHDLVNFIVSKLIDVLNLPQTEVKLKRPSVIYSPDLAATLLQLAANGEIAREDIYPMFGIDNVVAAQGRAIRENQAIQSMSQEKSMQFNRQMQQGSMADMAATAAEQGIDPTQASQGSGAPGAPPVGGAPGAGGQALDYSVDPNGDPSSIEARAEQIADQWLQMADQQPNSQKPEMRKCESINPTLYASATQAMEKKRREAASQGRAQAGQIAAGGGPGAQQGGPPGGAPPQ